MPACAEVRYETAGAAYEHLREAVAGKRAPRLQPCGDCRGWHLQPRRVTRAQLLARPRRRAASSSAAATPAISVTA
jgi:hypothetical protein